MMKSVLALLLLIGQGCFEFLNNNSQKKTVTNKTASDNKGEFCNTIASVALVHTSIQSD